MKCNSCGKDMKEETLFTTVEYKCNCEDGWQTSKDMIDLLSPMDLPIKLLFKDEDGRSGSILIGDMDYFNRCPSKRKFKIQRVYDPYLGLQKGMTESEVATALYGYSIDSDDDGC